MRKSPPFRRLWLACVLASLLAHLLLWEVGRWLGARQAETRITAQLEPRDRRPFRLQRRPALPPGKPSFAGRPSFRISPRPLKGLSPGTAQEYLERGVSEGMDTRIGPADLYPTYQGIDTLFAHPEWEQSALRAWRDSLILALEIQAEWEGLQPLDPFEVETLARGQGLAVVVLDTTGQLVRAYCSIPIYGIHVPRANKMNTGGRAGRNAYADFIHALQRGFRELSEGTPLHLELDDHYRVEADSTRSVSPDPIHRRGEFPHREALTLEQMRQYPVVPLQFIDAESTAVLAQYVLEGGFAVMDQRQLEGLAVELGAHTDLQTHLFELAPSHPLLHIYYDLAGYPIRGLELNGRLAGIAAAAKVPLLINASIYTLMQPSSLATRFVEQ